MTKPIDPPFNVIKPVGILDSTQTGQLLNEITALLQNNAQVILIDLEAATFMDSSGLGTLVIALKTIRQAGAKLYLCSMNNQIRLLFELTSMDKVFEIFADEDAFRNQGLLSQPGGHERECANRS